jgi:hypothetical protein
MTGRITVILGPPCAGKSTYVETNRTSTDVVVDYDKLAIALGATASHEQSDDIKRATFVARRAVIDHLLSEHSKAYAWIIHSAPKPEWMQRYAEADANVITLNPGIDTCLARATDDNRPQRTIDAIHKWYDKPPTQAPAPPQNPAETVLNRFTQAYKAGRFNDLQRNINAPRP